MKMRRVMPDPGPGRHSINSCIECGHSVYRGRRDADKRYQSAPKPYCTAHIHLMPYVRALVLPCHKCHLTGRLTDGLLEVAGGGVAESQERPEIFTCGKCL